ncbi:hypothetical protein SDC9_142853 [bioreactor metagenome]|uniref:Uncharacterized protein n=1 Tax=bioreactor metagenome TaxID=1076179 RepID=A0A645E2T9_9ZZZZ
MPLIIQCNVAGTDDNTDKKSRYQNGHHRRNSICNRKASGSDNQTHGKSNRNTVDNLQSDRFTRKQFPFFCMEVFIDSFFADINTLIETLIKIISRNFIIIFK